MKKPYAFLLAFILLSACATTEHFKNLSAGYVGCPKDELTVSEPLTLGGTASWEATCRGRKFYCSAVANKSGSAVACKEELKPSK